MKIASTLLDDRRAVAHLLDLLAVEGLSGAERVVSARVREKLLAAGCKPAWIRSDRAHERIGRDFEVGNLIVRIPGTRRGPRLLFASHLDTVPLCRGAAPVRRGNRIVARGKTALGADNRTAVACLVSVIETLLARRARRHPLTFLFTVGEEVGLLGARHVSVADVGRPVMGFNIDSGDPAKIVRGCCGAERWEASITGRAAHAGVHPEDGVSALLIATRAIAEVDGRGCFGLVREGRRQGTTNVGVIETGKTTNTVSGHALVRGECRSHDPEFLMRLTTLYREAFERAAASVRNVDGKCGRVRFTADRSYDPYRLAKDAAPVRRALEAARALGMRPRTVVADGGLDAAWLTAKGIPSVTLGAGQHNAHTLAEYADVREYLDGCRLAVTLATRDA